MDLTQQSTLNLSLLTDDDVVAVNEQNYALITVKGKDSKSFINRLVTANVFELMPQQSSIAAFLNHKGRIIDIVHILVEDNDTLLILCHRQKVDELEAMLERYIFVEDVTVVSLSEIGCIRVIGANKFSNQGSFRLFDSFKFKDNNDNDLNSQLIMSFASPMPCHRALTSSDVQKILGAHMQWHDIDEQGYEVFRIHSLVPKYEHEISDQYNPLEINLHSVISWNKGCYIGQEVISRLDTYQKQKRFLVAISMNEQDYDAITVGDRIIVNGDDIGVFTSKSPIFMHDKPSALGVVKGIVDTVKICISHIDRTM